MTQDTQPIAPLPESVEAAVYACCLGGPPDLAALEALRHRRPEHAAGIEALVRRLHRAEHGLAGVRELLAADAELAPGAVLGQYRIRREIGRGTFGCVYEAEQIEPVRRSVALKVLFAHHHAPEVLARFDAERQLLAQFDHPGIARIFDAGTTADGRPFFAMELLAGEPVTVFADRRSLDVEARLCLFLQVCAAVAHAHRRGVIHRDLKPGNVLVHDGDGGPVVKVIDFGLAKVLDPDVWTGHALATESGRLLGTPEYMSLEQASGLAIDTRADVYSLGAMLYELLCGRLPFDSVGMRREGLRSVLRVLAEETPPLPSQVALRQDRAALTARGAGSPRALQRRLRGDLDQIVACAIAKDPEDRYSGAAELAGDLERHLRAQPVEARAAGLGYVLSRLARRHRGAFAAAALALLAVVVGGIAIVWSLGRVTRARDEALAANAAAARRAYAMTMASALAAADACRTGELRDLLAAAAPERRGLEWDFLAARVDDARASLELDGTATTTLGLVGGALLSYDRVGEHLVLRDGADGRVRFREAWPWQVSCTASRGPWTVVAGIGGNLTVFASADFAQRRAHRFGADEIKNIAFVGGPDRLVAAAGRELLLLDVATGATLARQSALGAAVECVAAMDDGSAVVWGEASGVVAVWDLVEDRVQPLFVHPAPVRAIAVHPDGRHVATACRDRGIALLRRGVGRPIAEQVLQNELPQSLLFTPDGRHLVSGQSTGSVRWWNGTTLRDLAAGKGHHRLVIALVADQDGGFWSASWDGTARHWAAEPPRDPVRLSGLFGTTAKMAFDARLGRLFATSLAGEVAAWRTDTFDLLWRQRLVRGMCEGLLLAPDGSRLWVAENSGQLAELDAEHGAVRRRVRAFVASTPRQLAFAADGMLVVSSLSGELAALDPDRLEVVRRAVPPAGAAVGIGMDMVAHPSGLVTLCMPSCGVRTFDLERGSVVWERLDLRAGSAALSPQGTLWIGCNDGALVELDPATGHDRRRLQGPSFDHRVSSLACTADGRRLLVVNRRNLVVDPTDGAVLLAFDNDRYPPSSLLLAESARFLVTGGGYFHDDAELLVWPLRRRTP